MKRRLAILAVFAGLSLGLLQPNDARADAKKITKRALVRVSRILELKSGQKRTSRLVAEIRRTFDHQAFESKVLVDAKEKLSTDQRQRFSAAFQKMFERKLISLTDDPHMRCEKYSVERTDTPGEIRVNCRNSGETAQIILHFTNGKPNKIIDLTISDALLSRNYRGVINKILRRDGAEALIAKIESKTSDTLTKKSLL